MKIYAQAPYYDDYDAQRKYYRTLFRYSYPVQSRELTQLQTVLQAQLERLGDHFFAEGAQVINGQMSFDTTTLGDGQLSVKSVSDVIAGVAPSEVEGMVTALAAFSFDVDGQTEEGLGTTVVLSFYLGDLYDGASQLAVWHRKNAGDAWKLLNTEVKYDGENALFTADRFSDYMVGAVPEPAAVAGILGSLALAFSAYRRQNRR